MHVGKNRTRNPVECEVVVIRAVICGAPRVRGCVSGAEGPVFSGILFF